MSKADFAKAAIMSRADRLSHISKLSKIPKYNSFRGANDPINRVIDSVSVSVCAKKENPIYTGDAMLGVATLHKSNAVPVFSDQEAKDISSMRR